MFDELSSKHQREIGKQKQIQGDAIVTLLIFSKILTIDTTYRPPGEFERKKGFWKGYFFFRRKG